MNKIPRQTNEVSNNIQPHTQSSKEKLKEIKENIETVALAIFVILGSMAVVDASAKKHPVIKSVVDTMKQVGEGARKFPEGL